MAHYFSLALSTLLFTLLVVFVWSVTLFTSGYNIPREAVDTTALLRNLLFAVSGFVLLCVTSWLPIRRPIAARLMSGFGLVFLGACQAMLSTLVVHHWALTRWLDMLAIPCGLLIASWGLYEFGKAYRLNRLMIGSYRKIEESLATVDQITQLPNRRVFLNEAPQHITRSKDELIRVRVENLKQINREFDFNSGDAVLLQVARQISRLISPPALAARMSGNSFYILLPGSSREEAEALARNLLNQASWQAVAIDRQQHLLKVTLKVEHSTRKAEEKLEDWLHRIAEQ